MYYLFGRGDGAGLIIKNFEFIECVCVTFHIVRLRPTSVDSGRTRPFRSSRIQTHIKRCNFVLFGWVIDLKGHFGQCGEAVACFRGK